jgi:AcrR family transcriptional regulator
MSRPYRMTQRAASIQETRRRIVDAAVELHDELGPARTTIKAIASREWGQRLTVYRHFPDEIALLTACSSKWTADNPPPDPAEWERIAHPEERLRHALLSLYGYYQRNERMLGNLMRDEAEIPFLKERMDGFRAYLRKIEGGLLEGWRSQGRGKHRVRALLRHSLALGTWRSLRAQELDSPEAAELMVTAVAGAARP